MRVLGAAEIWIRLRATRPVVGGEGGGFEVQDSRFVQAQHNPLGTAKHGENDEKKRKCVKEDAPHENSRSFGWQ